MVGVKMVNVPNVEPAIADIDVRSFFDQEIVKYINVHAPQWTCLQRMVQARLTCGAKVGHEQNAHWFLRRKALGRWALAKVEFEIGSLGHLKILRQKMDGIASLACLDGSTKDIASIAMAFPGL
ncbi:hypothetical protein [Marivita hallyeonensis]|uniref:hypothetical protein n=1 Tax=Marivita hallyeonensis TaxID=996342 RepID=UPI0015B66078|nr:hypothetical protein [Marivita hallyeonensis]